MATETARDRQNRQRRGREASGEGGGGGEPNVESPCNLTQAEPGCNGERVLGVCTHDESRS